MVIKFVQYAKPYERFDKDAFKPAIGSSFVTKFKNKPVGTGKLLKAEVIEDGRAVELEIEVDDNSPFKILIDDDLRSISMVNEEKL